MSVPAPQPGVLLIFPLSPTHSNISFVFILAFAGDRNRDGNFTSFRDTSVTPQLIGSLQQANPHRRFTASLGGDNWPRQDPSDATAWVNNAVTSPTNMKDMYPSDGFDLNHEQNLDATFLPVKEQVTQAMNNRSNFPPRFQTSFWVTPFGQTYRTHTQISVDETSWIPEFIYQAYADRLTNVQAHLDKYANLAGNNPNRGSNGYQKISLGISSSNARGLQPPDIYSVWNSSLHGQRAINVVLWCLEDSAQDNFAIESAIQAMSLN